MGMRRNVALSYGRGRNQPDGDYPKIYFYTHWGAEHLEDVLRAALVRGRSRWGDPDYLARIIFSEMIQREVLETTGYGIAPYECDPEFPTVEVNLVRRTVNGVPYEEFISAKAA